MVTDKKQLLSLEDYKDQLWTCLMCNCGFCLYECPAYKETGTESAGPRGRNHIALAMLNGELQPEDLPDDLVYICTTCRYCETICPQNTPFVVRTSAEKRKVKVSGATTSELLRSLRTEAGKAPFLVGDALKKFSRYGNPYGGSKEIKDTWVTSLGLNSMDVANKEAVFYVGATVPYDERATKAAEAVFRLLADKLSLGMLGSEELDSGGLVRPMGEEGLFEEFVNHLAGILEEQKVKKVICLSPHDYDAFLSYYPDLGIQFEHWTETVASLIENGGMAATGRYQKKVTYQDPCYLGRARGVYEPSRKILQSIPGLELVEMSKVKDESHCCGGGGVGLWFTLPEVRMDLTRADEANETGAEVLATACPICLQMLDSAVKSRGYSIEVKDVGQILQEAISAK